MSVQRIPPGPGQESVWDYPRPPRLEAVQRHIRIVIAGKLIAQTQRAHRVLETSHPPVYYIARQDIAWRYLKQAPGSSYCEWKGLARYFDVQVGDTLRRRAAWSYPEPTPDFGPIRDALAFYPQLMDECIVDGERVTSQPGGFYGGWITSDIVGPFKGEPGTESW